MHAPVTLETSSMVWAPFFIAYLIFELDIDLQVQTFVILSRISAFKLFSITDPPKYKDIRKHKN